MCFLFNFFFHIDVLESTWIVCQRDVQNSSNMSLGSLAITINGVYESKDVNVLQSPNNHFILYW